MFLLDRATHNFLLFRSNLLPLHYVDQYLKRTFYEEHLHPTKYDGDFETHNTKFHLSLLYQQKGCLSGYHIFHFYCWCLKLAQ